MAIEKGLYSAPLGIDEGITDMEEMEVPDLEIEIVDPEAVTLSDGSMEVTIIPGTEIDLSDFNANLAELLDDTTVNVLSSTLMELVEADIDSRKEWTETYVDGLDVLGFRYEERTAPWLSLIHI